MSATNGDMLQVPGAQLFYKVRGSGPLLLIIQGGDGDADGMSGLVDLLAEHYRVVTFDPRGLSRSKLEAPPETLSLETHADDAHHLLSALSTTPALVFGASRGALVGLDLVSRYGAQVRTLVAHEPPATQFLSEAARALAAREQEDVEETHRREGVVAAMRKFAVLAGMDFRDREPGVELPKPNPGRVANLEFFLKHDAPAVRLYRLDINALRSAPTRIVLGVGQSSGAVAAHQCAQALAAQLGTPAVTFPGGHSGFITHPRAFAAKLREILDVSA